MNTFLNTLKDVYTRQSFDELRTLIQSNSDYILDNESLIVKSININESFLVHLDAIFDGRNTKFNKLCKEFNNFCGLSISQASLSEGNIDAKLSKFKEYLTYKNQYLLTVLP